MYAKRTVGGTSLSTVGNNEWPFYEQDMPTQEEPVKEEISVGMNAITLSNYQVSPAANPSPNTLVPVGDDGLLPVAIVPASTLVHPKSRDGLKTYNLVVEADGAISVDLL